MEKNETYVVSILILSILLLILGLQKTGTSYYLGKQKAYVEAGYEQVQNIGACGYRWVKAK